MTLVASGVVLAPVGLATALAAFARHSPVAGLALVLVAPALGVLCVYTALAVTGGVPRRATPPLRRS